MRPHNRSTTNRADRGPYRARADVRTRRRRRLLALAAFAAFSLVAAVGALAISADRPSSRAGVSSPRPSPAGAAAPGAGGGPAAPTGPAAEGKLQTLRVGSGARGAEVVRPAGAGVLPGVVFLHGWGLVARSDYRPWIRHLARAGNQVIVPRYQRNEDSDPGRALEDAVAGIRAALREAPIAGGSLVVAGHSAGAALGADYAASAAARRLPRAVAVLAVYPGRRILGYPRGIPERNPARIPGSTRLVAMAGATDVVVGRAPARELIASATGVPASRKRYVLVRSASVADHYGPTRTSSAARRVFWARLDRLIQRARASG